MEKLYNIVENFTSYPGVSGFEDMAFDELKKYVSTLGIFDEIGTTSVGSFYGIMRCGKENAPLVLCDAHLDTVGFVVTEICEGGFLRIANVGGIAAKILPATEVYVYGKETIRGIFGSKPPHLQEPGESEKKMNVTELFIDTGLPTDELKKLVRVGTSAGFPCRLQKLLGENLAGAGFDDRLCGAAIVRALMMLDKSSLNVDVAFQFSGGEEIGYKGAMTTAYRLDPDKAIVIDVTHAFVPGAPKTREGVRAGKGGDICFSPQTHRNFTKFAISVAEKEGIPYQLSAAPGRTGTNSNAVQTARDGIPTFLISIPLKNMHTMSEIVDMNDALNTSRVVAAVIKAL
jgi:endoglucanase